MAITVREFRPEDVDAIEWREADGHILMTGPYALDYEGTLPAELFQPARV